MIAAPQPPALPVPAVLTTVALLVATTTTTITLANQNGGVSPRVDANYWDASGNGIYGRFEGDLDLGLQLGLAVGEQLEGVVGLSAHYFSTAGLFLRHAEALRDGESLPAPSARRRSELGIELRPMFLPRFALDMERGPSIWDLTLDSLSLGVGVFVAQPAEGSFADDQGFLSQAGLGVPLLGTAPGPWLELRGVVRWPDSSMRAEGSLLVFVSWHELYETALTEAPL